MTITVKTASGSVYRFTKISGRTYVIKENKWAGEVIGFQKHPIQVGKCIEMLVSKSGVFKQDNSCLLPVSTTAVEEIFANL